MLNEENETMISPYKQAMLTLSMIRGPLVDNWVYEWIDHLHNQHHTNNVPMEDAVLDWAQWFLLPCSSGQLCILYTGDQVC